MGEGSHFHMQHITVHKLCNITHGCCACLGSRPSPLVQCCHTLARQCGSLDAAPTRRRRDAQHCIGAARATVHHYIAVAVHRCEPGRSLYGLGLGNAVCIGELQSMNRQEIVDTTES